MKYSKIAVGTWPEGVIFHLSTLTWTSVNTLFVFCLTSVHYVITHLRFSLTKCNHYWQDVSMSFISILFLTGKLHYEAEPRKSDTSGLIWSTAGFINQSTSLQAVIRTDLIHTDICNIPRIHSDKVDMCSRKCAWKWIFFLFSTFTTHHSKQHKKERGGRKAIDLYSEPSLKKVKWSGPNQFLKIQ